MAARPALERLPPAERADFCREVMERLSDLIEGEAPEELCARVEELLGDCEPFQAYRNTLEETIRLARECARRGPATHETARVEALLEKVKARHRELAE